MPERKKRNTPSDLLYDRMMSLKLHRASNFLNMPNGLDSISPLSRVDHYPQPSSWRGIACDTERVVAERFEIKTDCRAGRSPLGRYKFFVRLSTSHGERRRRMNNLYDYVRHLQSGYISRAQHISLFDMIERRRKALEKRMGQPVLSINENREVPLLHFKFIHRL